MTVRSQSARQSLAAAATVLALAASGCGSGEPDAIEVDAPASATEAVTSAPVTVDNGDQTATPPTPAASPEGALALLAPRFGDLDALVEQRVIRILTVYGPGRYYLDDGPRGTVAELAKKLEQEVNAAYETGHIKVNVLVVPVARDQLFGALKEGRGDIIIAGTTITDARRAEVDFTDPSSKPLREIVVTGASAESLESVEDLSGKAVYVRASSSYAESVAALNERLVAAGRAPAMVVPLPELLEDADLLEMVDTGLLPWVIVDDYKARMWEDALTGVVVRDDLVLREGARLGWAIRQESPILKDFLNRFLDKTREGTLFGNILLNRYVRDFDWTKNALAEDELGRYEALRDYFQRHGESYGINPTLLAAQGFQESRLDQSARSAAGAIGVMQLLQSTAEDRNVGISDIHEIDPNIEAGAKYMAFLKRRYFSAPEFDDINSALFALAAYNAGPSRVRQLRSKAEARGYNPHVWFDNVEILAAEDIGRETVEYVANIFKYRLTYEMVALQADLKAQAREAFRDSATQ